MQQQKIVKYNGSLFDFNWLSLNITKVSDFVVTFKLFTAFSIYMLLVGRFLQGLGFSETISNQVLELF
jgi:hypothetical protein